MKFQFVFAVALSLSAHAEELTYQPYSGDACGIYQSLDVSYQPLLNWFSQTTSSCSQSARADAKKQTLTARASLRRYVTAGRDSSVNDPIYNPSFRPNGANTGAGELYFAAECALKKCGGEGRDSGRSQESEPSQPSQREENVWDNPPRHTPPVDRPYDDGKFQFDVCNLRYKKIWVSVVYEQSGTGVVKGWWPVEARSCETIGRFPKGYFYFFAQTFGTNPIEVYVAGSQLTKFCVEERNFTHDFRKRCETKLQRDFSVINATGKKHTWEIQ